MVLDLNDCEFRGPALPEPFVKFELDKELTNLKLLPKTAGDEGDQLRELWDGYRRKLYALAATGGALRVRNHVVEPLQQRLGYARLEDGGEIQTREDREPGGTLLVSADGAKQLRVWATSFNEDLYAPSKRGRAYRFSYLRVAQRVLLATGERLGLLTNGVHLLLLISDPARPDSTVSIPIDSGWKRSREVPDSFRLVLALACPAGARAVPNLVEKARLQQARVTKELRVQARQAVERFIQEIMEHPRNSQWFAQQADREALAKALWREGLVIVYRLLFILKLESSDDPARSFSFASTSLWRNTFSPSVALAPYAHEVIERGVETGSLLEDGIRNLFRMFEEGLECTELNVKPLGGALFGRDATPTLTKCVWGERAVAWLLDRLLWTPKRRGAETRERVHYGPLDVEDLGRVYEALLELEPGIATGTMCRLRRQKLEVVVPMAQGEKYRSEVRDEGENDADADDAEDEDGDEVEAPTRGKKTKVEWIEEILPNRFHLRVGLGRKASGSYYTPHSFVRFLVQETLGPQVAERSPHHDPKPLEILKLKVLDPAMGSGHFLVEACRFLGNALYEACRVCDEKAIETEGRADILTGQAKDALLEEARQWRQRVLDLPDPDDEMLRYLPSRSPEGSESGLSQKRAEALCRRLVATHCLYGVDKNPLAVELAKLSLWIESHAEGMPLTFLDHRLVLGDSLTGPFWHHLILYPSNTKKAIENLFAQDVASTFTAALHDAIRYVRELDASVGTTIADIQRKQQTKTEIDRALLPFRVAAAAWSGGVMSGPEATDDDAYAQMLQTIAQTGALPDRIGSDRLMANISAGLGVGSFPRERDSQYRFIESGLATPAVPYDLMFPEVFYPAGVPHGRRGFDAIVGNPPWEGIDTSNREFFGSFDFSIFDLKTEDEFHKYIDRLMTEGGVAELRGKYEREINSIKNIVQNLYENISRGVSGASGATPDLYQCFAERGVQLLDQGRFLGFVLPAALHANEGSTGLRRLYLEKSELECCFSFVNSRKLFEIHSSYKYAAVVVRKGGPTKEFDCAFYLKDDGWLFARQREPGPLTYTLAFVKATTGDALNLLELRSQRDVPVVEAAYKAGEVRFGDLRAELKIALNEELHLSKNKWRLTLTDEVIPNQTEDPRDPQLRTSLIVNEWLPFYEGKSIWQFSDMWGERPQYCVNVRNMTGKGKRLLAARFYRLAFRTVASSTNERSAVFVILPPATICSNSLMPEATPHLRRNADTLLVLSVSNCFGFDWLLRLVVSANITFNFLDAVPIPNVQEIKRFLVHAGLRLTCNHACYSHLWHEQLGDLWREGNRGPLAWPVLDDDDRRWIVRAQIDAIVADAYGFSRDDYQHVLSSFSHSSYPDAPKLCLEKYDELNRMGLQAFTQKYDPYWDIPLNENLPQPVIALPIPPEVSGSIVEDELGLFQASRNSAQTTRKKRVK